MSSLVRPITRRDIKGPALYGPIRDDFRRHVIALKRPRRVLVGDRVALVFENRHTLTLQIEEMCRAENLVRDDQIQAEIEVYNELIPNPGELSATMFLEIEDQAHLRDELLKFLGIDESVYLKIGGHSVRGQFEEGRSKEDKISAVQYVRFPFTAEAQKDFIDGARAELAEWFETLAKAEKSHAGRFNEGLDRIAGRDPADAAS